MRRYRNSILIAIALGATRVANAQPTPPAPLDPASILCQFCGKSWEQVPMLFQAKRRTMDPNTSAIVAVWICNKCVTQLGQILAVEPPGTRGLHWWQNWSYRARP